MFTPRVTQCHMHALSISASMVFGFLARVDILNFCGMAVSNTNPSFSSSSKYLVAHDIAAGFSTRSASVCTVKPLDNESCVTWSASCRVESLPASNPARSDETEVVVDACKGDGANIWRGVSLTFSHAAVNSPGFFTGVAGSDHALLFVSFRAFHCDNVSNGSGAGSLPFASLRCCSSDVFCIAAGMPRSSRSSAES